MIRPEHLTVFEARRTQLSRGALTTLEGVMLHERLLQGMQQAIH